MQISKYQKSLALFNYQEKFQKHFDDFLKTRLGQIWISIPWSKIIKSIRLKNSPKGPCSILSPRGKIALMFLKNFTQASDQQIIENLNSNIHHQIFCDVYLGEKKLTNYKIVSSIRCELASKLEIDKIQKELIKYWKPYMNNLGSVLIDATCYESDLRYPTDQKLLWESIEWSYKQMKFLSNAIQKKRPKTKHKEVKEAYSIYSKTRKKTYKKRTKITRRLLHLLHRLNRELTFLEAEISSQTKKILAPQHINKRSIIEKVYTQQEGQFSTGEKIKDRLVSLSKAYIRPIVRGKESKRVEFGAKVNKLQIDGINMIEKISFNNFNEGTHYESSIKKTEELTGEKVKITGSDGIYATNKNRIYASSQNIKTDFTRKGKAGKNEEERKQLSNKIRGERSTRLEGSFGTEKRNYDLRRVKARTKETEILWIFFGLHTKNALEIGRRMQRQKILEKQKKTA